MTPEQFCYWLQGYFELKQTIDHREGATPATMKMIEDHLKTVFVKVTPAVQAPVSDRTYVPTPIYNPVRMPSPDYSKINWPLDQVKITC